MPCTRGRFTQKPLWGFIASGILVLLIIGSQSSFAADIGSSDPSRSFPVPTLRETEIERIQQIITAWLECEECTEGQLSAVRGLGKVAVPTLEAILKDGPPSVILVDLTRYLKDSYRKVQQHQQATHKPPISITEDRYVHLHREGAVELYQIRAAKALRAIGSPAAQQALQDALQTDLPSHVALFVKQSMKAAEVPAE